MSESTGERVPPGAGGPRPADDEGRVADIVRAGPKGAVALAGIATAIVIALWFAFYFLVFLPRGVIQ
ncbi:hypothetical protein PXJ20_11325 [Paraburkholderia sp. A1RI_3L]|uniref:hypothetical protein n=1 Tax=Paraburkholderia TaxID=1822464 RepID=UPI0004780A78|nr:hypothetical protein [Paraburkholderia kururiensis]